MLLSSAASRTCTWLVALLLCACCVCAWLPRATASCTPQLATSGALGSCLNRTATLPTAGACSFSCALGDGITPLLLACPMDSNGTAVTQSCAQCGVGYSLNWTASSLSVAAPNTAAAASPQVGYSVSLVKLTAREVS